MRSLLVSILAVGVSAFSVALLRADGGAIADGVQRGEVRQQEIKSQTQRAADELAAIVAEFQANGIGDSADVKVLEAIKDVLGKLSQDQMNKVINLLASVRQENDTGKVRKNVADAFTGQKGIVVQLQQLLLEYERQQELAAVSLRFSQLAERQNANLKVLRTYRIITGDTNINSLNETQRTLMQVQTAEQNALKQEVTKQLERLTTLAGEVDPESAKKLAKVMAQSADGRLTEVLGAALDELTANHIGLAAAREHAGRDQLRDLSRLVAPAKDPLEVLRTAAEAIARLVQQQQSVIDSAKELNEKPDLLADKGVIIEEQQGDVVDDSDEVHKDIADVAADAASDLAAAELKMQLVRKALTAKERGNGVDQAALARSDLESARAKVIAALTRLEQVTTARDLTTQTQQLKEQVAALRAAEETLRSDTATPQQQAQALAQLAERQNALTRTARDLRSVAARAAPDVVRPMEEAARQMDQASQALATRLNNNEATANQDQALAALRQAEQMLNNRLEQLAQAQQNLNALEEARAQLARAIQNQQAIAGDAQQVAARQDRAAPQNPATQPGQTDAPPTERQIASRQAENARTTQDVQRQVGSQSPQANRSLDRAQTDMADAQNSLERPDARAATPQARSALNNLQQARQALDQRIGELQRQLGQQQDNASQLDQLAQALQRAQEDLAQALDAQREAAANLRQQQRQIASDLGQMRRQGQPVERAEDAAQQAADRLDRNQLNEAGQEMDRAMDEMNQSMRSQGQMARGQQGQQGQQGRQGQQGQRGQRGQPGQQGQAGEQGDDQSLPEIAQRQADARQALDNLRRQAEALAQAQQGQQGQGQQGQPGQRGGRSLSARRMAQLAGDITRAQTRDRGAMSQSTGEAMSEAEQALSDAAAEAGAGDQEGAQGSAQRAQRAMARAQAAVGMAQAGMGRGQQGQRGQAIAQAQGQRGRGQPGQNGRDGQEGQPDENNARGGMGNRRNDQVNGNTETAGSQPPDPASSFVGMPPRDRAAIQQSRNDQVPEEYRPLIEQYLKNLSQQGK